MHEHNVASCAAVCGSSFTAAVVSTRVGSKPSNRIAMHCLRMLTMLRSPSCRHFLVSLCHLSVHQCSLRRRGWLAGGFCGAPGSWQRHP